MFENTPLLKGNYLTYAEYSALYQTSMALGLSFMFFIASYFWKLTHNYIRIKLNKRLYHEKSQTFYDGEKGIISHNYIKSGHAVHTTPSQRLKIFLLKHIYRSLLLDRMPAFLSWIGWIGLASSPSQIFSMGLISNATSVCITFSVLFYRIIASESLERKMSKEKDLKKESIFYPLRCLKLAVLNKRKSVGIKTLLALLLAIFVNLLFENTCIAIYSDSLGIHINPVVSINTKFTRFFQIPQACPPGPPCHIYTTVPEDASKAVFLNIHTSVEVDSLFIKYGKLVDYNSNHETPMMKKESTAHKVDYIESKADRMVHTVLLEDLESNTYYKLLIYYDGRLQAERTYLSPPGPDDGEMKIIFGGDIGPSFKTDQMNQIISEHKPNALFLGGDLAYDNNLKGCYYCYDMFLHKFETLFEKMGYLIPMVLALGNHDIGLNSYPRRSLLVDNQTSLYFTYFPQHYSFNSEGQRSIPQIHSRRSVFHHLLGNNLIFTLDSGYLHKLDAYQPEYVNSISKEHPTYHKFAQYHRPIRPACKLAMSEFEKDGLAYWEPIFKKWKFSGIFENHAHTIKRTKKLGESSSNEKIEGVIYFGEGSWGSNPNKCKMSDVMGIMDVSGHINHVWCLTINGDRKHYAAIGFEPDLLSNYQGDF